MSTAMKAVLWITVAVLLVVVWLSLRARQNRTLPNVQQSDKSQTPDPKVYVGLRDMVLQASRAKFGLAPGSSPKEPYAVVMDWDVQSGTATVVAIADGTASVYLSSGGGFIGGGQSHESIRLAAKKVVEMASEVLPLMQVTTTYPLPQQGQVAFYVLTDAGVFTARVSEEDLRTHRSPLSKLGDSVQVIVTDYRRMDQN
jgi:hypothetical protein